MKPIRIFDGRYGRLMLVEASGGETPCTGGLTLALKYDGANLRVRSGEESFELDRTAIAVIGGDAPLVHALAAEGPPARLLLLQAATAWLGHSFPAVFGSSGSPAALLSAREECTSHIRRLADALTVEMLNDRFLTAERLEFLAQELMLSIVENGLLQRRVTPRLWEGSRFADSRVRRAVSLLRERPTKEVDIDRVASRVGLSRSRFYDLFQMCIGRSPREYLDFLCLGSAVTALATERVRIADVSQELGFSAQSNFTRFFLNRVGIPPSEYRRAARSEQSSDVPPETDPEPQAGS
jgi:AraC-like DNA-binding protein